MTDDFTVDFDDTPIDAGKEPQTPPAYYNIERLEAAHPPGLHQWLLNAKWSQFAQDLAIKLNYGHVLSEKQVAACVKMRASASERSNAADAKLAVIAALPPDYPALASSFLTASKTLKHPKLHLVTGQGRTVVLARLGMSSRTPGEISVTDGRPFSNNTYYGRITPEGRAYWRTFPDDIINDVKALLADFDKDPKAAVKTQGVKTGRCCICNAELTNPESVALGIGPICGGRWGI